MGTANCISPAIQGSGLWSYGHLDSVYVIIVGSNMES